MILPMQISKLDVRTRLSIAMGLVGDQGSPTLIHQHDEVAAQLGMSGAEIDAARTGRRFDVRGTRALELVFAFQGRDHGNVQSPAIQSAIDEDACREMGVSLPLIPQLHR